MVRNPNLLILDTGSLPPDEYARNLQTSILILLTYIFIEDGVELDHDEAFALYMVVVFLVKLAESWEASI